MPIASPNACSPAFAAANYLPLSINFSVVFPKSLNLKFYANYLHFFLGDNCNKSTLFLSLILSLAHSLSHKLQLRNCVDRCGL